MPNSNGARRRPSLRPSRRIGVHALQALNGVITPNSLHFERHHSGIPDIDPGRHRLTIAGQVRVPLAFDLNALLRYPMQSRILFLECSGNSYLNTMGDAQDLTAGTLSGLVSCAEWTGVPLSRLLEETGVGPNARWIVAEGADPSGNKRSLPIDLALDGAMIALYQNGEPIRPSQGFPMRLFVPGCEGNLSVKWLRTLEVTDQPAQSREETSKYTDLMDDGRARQFSLRMDVKSLITSPRAGCIYRSTASTRRGPAWSAWGHTCRGGECGRRQHLAEAPQSEAELLPCVSAYRGAGTGAGAPAAARWTPRQRAADPLCRACRPRTDRLLSLQRHPDPGRRRLGRVRKAHA